MFNFGSALSQPYESQYSTIRRALVSNPGRKLHRLKNVLQLPNTSDTLNKWLRQQQSMPKDDIPGPMTPTRQCPECAAACFHTNLYTLRWLKACPIHGCAFRYSCAICGRPWPKLSELEKRDCHGCGIPSKDDFLTYTLPLARKMNTTELEVVYSLWKVSGKLCLPNLRERFDYCYDLNPRLMWVVADEVDELYPSLVDHLMPSNVVRVKQATYRGLYCKEANLHPLDEDAGPLANLTHGYPLIKRVRPNQDALHDIYLVFKGISQWLFRVSDHRACYINDYRNLTTSRLSTSYRICPICSALSVWLFHASFRENLNVSTGSTESFPILYNHGMDRFLSLGRPQVYFRGEYFTYDEPFSRWLYRRSLMILFIDLFKFFQLLANIQRKLMRAEPFTVSRMSHHVIRKCGLSIHKGKLRFLYHLRDPLTAISPPHSIQTSMACKAFHDNNAARLFNPYLYLRVNKNNLCTLNEFLDYQNGLTKNFILMCKKN